MARFSKIFNLATLILLFIAPVFLEAQNSVIINEIAWMGTEINSNDEWIELYNPTNLEINISGWKLISKDGTPKIELEGKIAPDSYFILERTDDNTLPEIPADQIYKGALSNNGEYLELFDKDGNLIDFLDCSLGWFAGDNEEKLSMERIDPKISGNDFNNWKNSNQANGTPKIKNSPKIESKIKEEEKMVETKEVLSDNLTIENLNNPPESPKNFNILSISFGVAAVSAGLILILKQKV